MNNLELKEYKYEHSPKIWAGSRNLKNFYSSPAGESKNLKIAEGFTLIELIVALGVFMVAATISLSTLLGLTEAQRKAFATQNVQDNIRFALTSMSKEIRTGTLYHCGTGPDDISLVPRDCPLGGPLFTFRNVRGETVTYRISGDQLEKSSNGGASFQAITAKEITVENMTFYVFGSVAGDSLQPRVTIILRAVAGERERVQSIINLQTTLSQRKLDS